jgi:hypothetical protein
MTNHKKHDHHEMPTQSNYASRLLSRMLNDRKKPEKPIGVRLSDVAFPTGAVQADSNASMMSAGKR